MPSRTEVQSSDEELVAGCLRGEQAAWDALVNRYSALMYSIPLKFGLAEPDAADVFQSVCVTLLEKLGSVRAPAGLAAWIITTTSRQCLAVVRQRRHEVGRSTMDELLRTDAEPADPMPLPEEEMLALERLHLVRAAVGQLPSNCRQLVQALFSDAIKRASYEQLAELLGVPMNSVGPTRARCLAKLRRLLTAAGYTPY